MAGFVLQLLQIFNKWRAAMSYPPLAIGYSDWTPCTVMTVVTGVPHTMLVGEFMLAYSLAWPGHFLSTLLGPLFSEPQSARSLSIFPLQSTINTLLYSFLATFHLYGTKFHLAYHRCIILMLFAEVCVCVYSTLASQC